jgi:hypothetical protein
LNERESFFTFVNPNAPGSAQQYRVIIRNASGTANAVCTVNTLADSDHDGLPDEWETQYLDPRWRGRRVADGDGDGLNNVQEYNTGTNPTNAASFLKVQIDGLTNPVISFGAETNKTYTIQRAPHRGGPVDAAGQRAGEIHQPVESIVDPIGPARGFYRVVTPGAALKRFRVPPLALLPGTLSGTLSTVPVLKLTSLRQSY